MYLYHASTRKNLKIITPQRTISKGKYIGEYVFATRSKAYAAMYLTPKGRLSLLNVFNGKQYLVIQDSVDNFKRDDAGGAIYSVPADTFGASPQVELAETELVSRIAVTPSRVETYETALEALRTLDIPVYFVDKGLIVRMQKASDHGWNILQSLTPYTLDQAN